ncbi:MAG: hypothetical protein H6650_05685 [Ardenticatenales bacterium]|nr:hypothetical protein [Ardenticatenales bacterium]
MNYLYARSSIQLVRHLRYLPSNAPGYEVPADEGGIWGYGWFNADATGHFLHIWTFWSASARQTAAAVVPGGQGNGAARTEPRLYANVSLRLLSVETQRAASRLMRPPQAAGVNSVPMLEDTATVVYTRQHATLSLANMTIAIHVAGRVEPDEFVYIFAGHLGSTNAIQRGSDPPTVALPAIWGLSNGQSIRLYPIQPAHKVGTAIAML